MIDRERELVKWAINALMYLQGGAIGSGKEDALVKLRAALKPYETGGHNWKRESQYDTDPDSDWWRCTKCKKLTRFPGESRDCPTHLSPPTST